MHKNTINVNINEYSERAAPFHHYALKTIGKGFYRKWVKSSFEQFITTQMRVGSTNGWIISQNAEISKFYFSTISGICDVI